MLLEFHYSIVILSCHITGILLCYITETPLHCWNSVLLHYWNLTMLLEFYYIKLVGIPLSYVIRILLH